LMIAEIGSEVYAQGPSFSTGNQDQIVQFVVSAVADSVVQYGPFASEVQRGRLLSSVISVIPSAPINVDPQATLSEAGIYISIILSDQGPVVNGVPELSNSSKCDSTAKLLSVYTFQSDSLQKNASFAAKCSRGVLLMSASSPLCACKFFVPHFSSFGVVDDTVFVPVSVTTAPPRATAAPPATAAPAIKSPSANTDSSLSSASPAAITGSVIGAVAFVALVVAAVFHRNRILVFMRKLRNTKKSEEEINAVPLEQRNEEASAIIIGTH